MKTIPADIVEQTWKNVADTPVGQVSKLIDRLGQQQPTILAYLLGVEEDSFTQDEREILLYMGVVIWKMFYSVNPDAPRVSHQKLLKQEESNFKVLEKLMGESEGDFIAILEDMMNSYNQIEVLRYVLEGIMDTEDDDAELSEDAKGLIFIYLKTIIDCLDAQ